MFTEREQQYLKALTISALEVIQKDDFKELKPLALKESFTDYLDDYLSHFPLEEHPDAN